MYGILDRYVGKTVVFSVILISICLTLFAALINLIDVIRYIGRGTIDFFFILQYVCYKVPGIFVTFFPVSILIGGVIGLGMLAKNSEIVILQSIGLSKLNIGVSCIKSILPLIVVVLFIGETIAPHFEKIAEDRYNERANPNVGVSIISSGTWIKEGNSFICISATLNEYSLRSLYKFDYEGLNLTRISYAVSADWVDGRWIMKMVTSKSVSDDGIKTESFMEQEWPLHINAERLAVLSEVTENLSVFKLIDYINYLDNNGVDSRRYSLSFYNKVISPLVMLVMLLLALSTIFGPLRSMNMSSRILSGIALGFGYYVLNQIVAPFSLVYGVPPIIGASFATVVFATLAFYLLRRKS